MQRLFQERMPGARRLRPPACGADGIAGGLQFRRAPGHQHNLGPRLSQRRRRPKPNAR